jgi:FKBP-type peptidyl-prolyl cis-trans isomerase
MLSSKKSSKITKATLAVCFAAGVALVPLGIQAAPQDCCSGASRQCDNNSELTTDSGLTYRIINAGEGDSPCVDDTVTVNYSVSLLDGTPIYSTFGEESNGPETFPLKSLIKGWQEGLPLIHKGGTILLTIPPQLAYGEKGWGETIPPNATLIFEIELIDIQRNNANESK